MNKKLIKILKEISLLLKLKGDNPFKSRAYENAANMIREQSIDVEKAVHEGKLGELKGFGKALQEKISDYCKNGDMQYHKKLLSEVPLGLIEISRISNIGPKKARRLYYDHDICDLDELENAAKTNVLANIKGFGIKSQEIILNSIHHRKASRGRFLMQIAVETSEIIIHRLESSGAVSRISLIGANRRFSETIDGLQFLAATDDIQKIVTELSDIMSFDIKGDIINGKTTDDLPVIIRTTNDGDYSLLLHKLTGSDKYLAGFDDVLAKNDFRISEGQLLKNNDRIELISERQLYDLIGYQYVEPELREYPEILNQAREHKIPELIEQSDMKGMIHVHSNWSDGINSIKDMALESKRLGYSYIIICDHSQSAAYAGGLTPEDVVRQHEEIDALNKEDMGIKILKGIESDILPDGSLDYPENILKSFDLVVASVHSHFNMSEKDMTKRIVYALMSPHTTMLGHPTGRLLLARHAYKVDINEVIRVAASEGKIIEINANPYRLDLNWENAVKAKEEGVKMAVNPDSHETGTLTEVYFGIKIARKAALTKQDVVNCMPYQEFCEKYINK